MNRTTAFVTVALIAVILAAVLSLNVFFRPAGPAETAPPASSEILPPRTETAPPVTEAPTATQAPVTPPPATPAPATPPPARTPAPTATQAPATPPPVQSNASGSFRSDTGTGLNLVCDWKSYTEGGAVKLQVDVSVNSYRFNTDAIYAGLTLNVDGAVYSKNSPAVRYDGDALSTTYLTSFTVDAGSGYHSLSVTWDYRGTYSGKELAQITAYGSASIP